MNVLKNTTPTARKEHKCDFCSGVISIGEKYDRQTNVYDGRVYKSDLKKYGKSIYNKICPNQGHY